MPPEGWRERWKEEKRRESSQANAIPAAIVRQLFTNFVRFGLFSLAGPVSKVQRFMDASVTSLNCAGSARAVYDYYSQDVALSNFNIRLLDSKTLTLTRPKASEVRA